MLLLLLLPPPSLLVLLGKEMEVRSMDAVRVRVLRMIGGGESICGKKDGAH